MTEAEYLSVALSLGMGRREALLSPVGLVMEIAKLRADANKKALEGVRTQDVYKRQSQRRYMTTVRTM